MMMVGIQGSIVVAAGGGEHAALPPLFALLAIMLLSVVLVSLLLIRLQQSLLVGYFLCGVAVANSGVLELVGAGSSQGGIATMSEFGVMLLMFTLGLEFSLSDLKYLRRLALVGGALQMLLCAAPVALITWSAGFSWQAVLLMSVAAAMSSTAVSVKTFQDMELAGSPPARLALGVAIFQDIFIVGFFLVVPLLLSVGGGGNLASSVVGLLVRGVVFVLLSLVLARWVIPKLLHAVARTRNRELFTLTVVGLCIGVAFAGGLLHLSLALGAFVAGLAVSESIYKHRIMAEVMPLKDLFLTLFFVSVGLMIDLQVALAEWKAIVLLTLALMLVKASVVTLVARWLDLAPKAALLGGVSLASAGEFSLLLLQKAAPSGMWSPSMQQIMLAAAALSMGLLPAMMRQAPVLGEWLEKMGWRRVTAKPLDSVSLRKRIADMTQHAIICGYGPVGESLNTALTEMGMATLVVDLNADTVRRLQKAGQPVLFADAAHAETWELTRLATARLVAFTFPDATVTAAALEQVREHSADVTVLARARFASDKRRLKVLGADAVVHDEHEAARAAVAAVMKLCQMAPLPADVEKDG